MPEIMNIADFWDCEIEHAEAKKRWVSEHLRYIIGRTAGRWNLTKLDVEVALVDMAVAQAVEVQREVGDRILDFADGSRLGIVAMAANTMAGSSRVMEPGEHVLRAKIRGNRPYEHGVTRTAWYWTQNGKTYGKPDLVWAATDTACPKDGLWVRRFCNRSCGDKSIWAERLTAGTEMPQCADCRSGANYGWATP
ncbi:MAG: hypothetical protein OXL37_01575 [Chloroflexota bacterium]|nr:hypothetical protein [Chloroflexota bacterium]MDE2961294.1 hypothetical protein [Chloroflexota bacterium]